MWLAIAMTPVAWAASVKLASATLGGSELALRTVPFTFGCLTLWVAYRAGRRFAGHELGGVLALAVVAFEPLAIGYAKVLKQYTAEAFFALLAIDRAAAFAERRTRRDLVVLALVLVVGVGFANTQLFLAPPILAALLLDASGGATAVRFVARDRDRRGRHRRRSTSARFSDHACHRRRTRTGARRSTFGAADRGRARALGSTGVDASPGARRTASRPACCAWSRRRSCHADGSPV